MARRVVAECENRPVDGDLRAAVARLREAFARYPRRAVLEGCPHCRGSVTVDDHDLFALTIALGNTVGSREDVKGLLPVLLERMVTSADLDPSIVLGKLAQLEWRTWAEPEQDAVDGYLDAVWRSLLAQYPSRVGAFPDAAVFLDEAGATGDRVGRFLDAWDATAGPAADRHLADAVNGLNFAARRSSVVGDWLRRQMVRDRLRRAFERDHDRPWADDLARACDLLGG
jgi:hypothetical protein